MADSIFKQIGSIIKNLVDTTKTELQANINAITPTTLGLGNVNNTSDADKPVSTATQTALNTKQDIDSRIVFDGAYVHTDNNYTTPEKTKVGYLSVTSSIDLDETRTKLAGIESGATADQTAPEILTLVKTVDGVGSGLDADLLDGQEGSYYTNYTDTKIAELVASSPATLDTLNALAAVLGNDANFATTMTTQLSTKLNAEDYNASDVLTKLKTVDGTNSGLDADLLDGQQGSYYQPASTALTTSTTFNGDVSGTYNNTVVSQAAKLTTPRTISLSGDVTGSVSFDGSSNITISAEVANDSHTHDLSYIKTSGGVITGDLTVNGALYATSLTETSSIKFKENVQPLVDPMVKISALQGVSYTWKETGVADIGFIAEEVDKIIPEIVSKNDAGEVSGMNYGKLTALLVEAIKIQQAQIAELQKLIK